MNKISILSLIVSFITGAGFALAQDETTEVGTANQQPVATAEDGGSETDQASETKKKQVKEKKSRRAKKKNRHRGKAKSSKKRSEENAITAELNKSGVSGDKKVEEKKGETKTSDPTSDKNENTQQVD